jgi:glutathione S-transferase
MYLLYGTRYTGTCAVHAALEEAGAVYEQVEISTKDGEHRTEAYRAINPRQQVPTLRLPDGTVVTEGAAILLHIADAFPEAKLAPPPGTSMRALHDRWLIYFAVNVYEGELRKLFGDRYTTDPEGRAGVEAAADAYVKRHYLIFEDFLGDDPYCFGDQLTVLDIYLWMLAQWMDAAWLDSHCPRIRRLTDRVKERPKIAPVHAFNFW